MSATTNTAPISGTSVPTTADHNALQGQVDALAARVTALEAAATQPPQPPVLTPSSDGARATAPGTVLVDDALAQWRLVASTTAGQGNVVQWMPHDTTAWVAAGYSANVVAIEKFKATCYQTASGGWWYWNGTDWAVAPGDPSAPAPQPPAGVFTVDANGFKDSAGNVWQMRGLNGSPQDAIDCFGHIFQQFPHMNLWRLNCNSNNNEVAQIDQAVQQYTGKNCVVLIEDHSGNTRNTGWYTQYAQKYAGNPLVFLGTPNEPGGDVTGDATAVVQAIRAAGFHNPIGLQCKGGYDFSPIQGILNNCGRTNLFCTPHIYYSGTDQNGSQAYIDTDINNCTNLGLWCVFTEFGDGMDGWHRDQWGIQLVRQVIAAQQAGRCGAVFWAADNNNHPDGCCSALLTRDGSQLTNPVTGVDPIQPWLRA